MMILPALALSLTVAVMGAGECVVFAPLDGPGVSWLLL
jgi:hypothetical protein